MSVNSVTFKVSYVFCLYLCNLFRYFDSSSELELGKREQGDLDTTITILFWHTKCNHHVN